MKLHLAAFALLPLLAAAAPRTMNAPDLRIIDVTSPNYDRGIVRVQVRNQGNADAPANHISVSLSGLATGVVTVPFPALQAGTTVPIIIQMHSSLSGVHFTVRVDRSNVVAEPNETNNIMSGTFGGKP